MTVEIAHNKGFANIFDKTNFDKKREREREKPNNRKVEKYSKM